MAMGTRAPQVVHQYCASAIIGHALVVCHCPPPVFGCLLSLLLVVGCWSSTTQLLFLCPLSMGCCWLSAVIGCYPSSSSAIIDQLSSLIITSGHQRKAWLNMGRVWPGLFQALGHLKRKKK